MKRCDAHCAGSQDDPVCQLGTGHTGPHSAGDLMWYDTPTMWYHTPRPQPTADFLRGAQHVIVGQPKRETTEAALLAAYMAAGLTASEAYIEIIRQLHLALEALP